MVTRGEADWCSEAVYGTDEATFYTSRYYETVDWRQTEVYMCMCYYRAVWKIG